MSVDLVAFLKARLDEDEALARQAAQVAGPDWTWKTEVPEGCDYPTDYITSPDGTLLLDTMGGIEGDAPHVARHDPARVLREVEAERRMLAEVRSQIDNMDAVMAEEWDPDRYYSTGTTGASDLLLKLLALPYSNHPDYRPEWKPTSG